MSIKLKLNFFDFRHLRTDISRLQFNLVVLKLLNAFLVLTVLYEGTLLLNLDTTKLYLVVGVIFSLLLLCFCIQRIQGLAFKPVALCLPLLFLAPDKYGYDYDKDSFYIICVTVKRVLQLCVEVAVVVVLLLYLRMSIPSLSCVPAPIKVIAYSLPFTEEKESTQNSITLDGTTIVLGDTLSVSTLSEGNVVVLDYNSKYVEFVVYADNNTFEDWVRSDDFYRKHGVAIKFYNATEAEINSILEDTDVRN